MCIRALGQMLPTHNEADSIFRSFFGCLAIQFGNSDHLENHVLMTKDMLAIVPLASSLSPLRTSRQTANSAQSGGTETPEDDSANREENTALFFNHTDLDNNNNNNNNMVSFMQASSPVPPEPAWRHSPSCWFSLLARELNQ